MTNQQCLVLSHSWWNFGFLKRRKSKRERRRNLNRLTNSWATSCNSEELTHTHLNNSNNLVKATTTTTTWCQVDKDKVWACQTNNININKEILTGNKEVIKEVAEEATEEVREADTCKVDNNILKDHLKYQVPTVNNSPHNSNNNNKCHHNLEWHHNASHLWVFLNNKCNNNSHYCLYLRLIWTNSKRSLKSLKRSNSLETLCILKLRRLSEVNLQVKLQVCWLMKMLWTSSNFWPIKHTSHKRLEKLWIYYNKLANNH